ncbi:MAG: biotin/lipoyl-containing protein [Bdellovibrionota bacterium]
MKSFTFEIDGKTHTGRAVLSNGTVWAHVDGQTFVYESPEKRSIRRAGKSMGNTSPDEIRAPMPGKIVKINVMMNSKVEAHDVIVVMEAMKMEYTLKAQAPGRVSRIGCVIGDQVSLGQLLVKLET